MGPLCGQFLSSVGHAVAHLFLPNEVGSERVSAGTVYVLSVLCVLTLTRHTDRALHHSAYWPTVQTAPFESLSFNFFVAQTTQL